MNTKIEIYVYAPEERQTEEELTKLVIAASELACDLGYGNTKEDGDDEPPLHSIVTVRVEDNTLEEAAEGAQMINLPTRDKAFLDFAAAGGIPSE